MLCNEGANLPCGKTNIRRSLPGATAWCRKNRIRAYPDGRNRPRHDLYMALREWCRDAGRPVRKIHARGFFADYWRPLP